MKVEQAIVASVDPKRFVATVVTEKTGDVYEDVRFATPYAHPSDGQGAFCLPEEGAVCFLAWPNDESPPFILGYTTPPVENEGLRGARQDAAPGDFVIAGTERNYVAVRAGGVVEIVSTPLSSILLFPVENLIQLAFRKLRAINPNGELTWIGTEKAARFEFHLADSPGGQESIIIRAGGLDESKHVAGLENPLNGLIVLEALVGDSLFGFHIDSDGQASGVAKNVGWKIKGHYEVNIAEVLKLRARQLEAKILQSAEFTATDITIKGQNLTIAADTSIAGTLTVSPGRVSANKGSGQPLVKFGPLATILSILAAATGTSHSVEPLISQLPTEVFRE